MDNSFISSHCANCAITFSNASQTFTAITIVDDTDCSKIQKIAILDAIFSIYGFSATNLASAFLNYEGDDHFSFSQVTETSEYIAKHGLPLCTNCVSVFKEVYVAVHQLKKLSDETSVLDKAIKTFSPPSIKVEAENKSGNRNVEDCIGTTRRVRRAAALKRNPARGKLATPEPEGTTDEELFQAYQFEQEYGESESEQEHDVKIDPLANKELKNCSDLISASESVNDSTVDNSGLSIKRRSSRQGQLALRKTTAIIKKKVKGSIKRKTDRSKTCRPKKHCSAKPTSTKSYPTGKSASALPNMKKDSKIPKPDGKDTKQYKRRPASERILTKEQEEIARTQLKSLLEARVRNRSKNSEQETFMNAAGKTSGEYSKNFLRQNQESKSQTNQVTKSGQLGENDSQTNQAKEQSRHTQSSSTFKKPTDETNLLLCTCGSGHSTLAGLRKHERRHIFQDPVVVCDVCGQTFIKNSLLYAHQNREHSVVPEISLKCNFCDAKYLDRYCLKRHVENHHPTTPNSLVCDKCGNTFNSLRNLQRHTIRTHKDENLDKELFRCKECGISLKHSDSLRKHKMRMHGNQKTFVCPQCGKITKSMTNMRIHMKVHDPNRTFKRKASDLPSQSNNV